MPAQIATTQEASNGPLAARLQHFRDLTIAHPRLMAVKDRLMEAIEGAAPGSLILVLGPAGVGKTTLRHKVEQLLMQGLMRVLESNAGRLPFVSVEAAASVTGNFSWREHFTRVLREMNEPLVESKLRLDRFYAERDWRGQFTSGPRAAGLELQYAVEQALRYRCPAAVFIDEAQHLARMASGRKLSDQLDVIKSIANRTQTVHVLIGTYELLAFRNLSGQLSRRSVDIHFSRYAAENPEDLQVFKNVLLTFQNQVPLRGEFDLVSRWDFMYERSAGCVGILKEWLTRATVAAIKSGEDVLSRKHLETTALSVAQCEKIVTEAREGEMRLAESQESRSRLRNLLALGASSLEVPQGGQDKQIISPGIRKRRAGQRSPKRDTVGRMTAAYA